MTKLLLLWVTALISLGAYGAENPNNPDEQNKSCPDLLENTQEVTQETSEVDAVFADLEAGWRDSLTARGYLGYYPENTPENAAAAFRHGLLWWGTRVIPVESREEAEEHMRQYDDITKTGVYIVGDKSLLGVDLKEGEVRKPVDAENMKRFLQGQAYEVVQGENGFELVDVSQERIQKYFSPEDFVYMDGSNEAFYSYGKDILGKSGWVALKQRGVIDHREWIGRRSAKRVRKSAQKLAEMGFKVVFNKDFRGAVEATARQQRQVNGEVLSAEQNRYAAQPELIDIAVGRYERGNGYSVEIYDPEGRLVGGEFGFRHGNRFYGESVFYDPDNLYEDHPEIEKMGGSLIFAKISALALGDELDARGVHYVDAGIVSAYTNSTGGKYVSREEYLEMMATLPEERVSLPEEWDSYSYPKQNVEQIFANMVKQRSQSLSGRGFMGQYPAQTSANSVLAQRYGIMSWNLWVFVAPSVEEAAKHAEQGWYVKKWDKEAGDYKKDKDGNDIMTKPRDPLMGGLYLIGEPVGEVDNLSPASPTLKALMKNGAYVFPDPNDTSRKKFISADQLEKMLNPNYSADDIRWRPLPPPGGYGFTVPGWHIPTQRGFLSADILDSDKYKKFYNKFIRANVVNGGLTVTMNKAHKESMDMLKNQKRRNQSAVNNRFYDPNDPNGESDDYKAMMARLKEGSALTVEVWGPDGTLVGGTVVKRIDNALSPDTIFYMNEDYYYDREYQEGGSTVTKKKKVVPVDAARFAAFALIDVARKAGISGVDAGMVSKFTAGMGGKYIPRDEYLDWLQQNVGVEPVELSFDGWTPHRPSSSND